MSFSDIPSVEELVNRTAHDVERPTKPGDRILIVGYESVGRDLARLLIKKHYLGRGLMPGIDIVRPDEISAETFEFNLRKCMPDIDVSDMFREEQVLRTDERNLKELLKLSLEHKNQKTTNRGPEGRGRHARWR